MAGSSRGSAYDMMSSTPSGATMILGRTGLFHPHATRITLVSASLAHGLHQQDSVHDMQKNLLHHLLSGHCARDDDDELMHGCIRISGPCASVASLGDVIRADVVRTIHDHPSVAAEAGVHLCRLLDIPLSHAAEEGYDSEHLFLDDLREYMLAYAPLPYTLSSGNHSADVVDVLHSLEYHTLPRLRALARAHGISVRSDSCRESLRVLLSAHLAQGRCAASVGGEGGLACLALRQSMPSLSVGEDSMRGLQIDLLTMLSTRLHSKALRRTLTVHGVQFDSSSSRGQLRRALKAHITTLRKGKRKEDNIRALQEDLEERASSLRQKLEDVRAQWPRRIPDNIKESLIHAFREDTSSIALKTFTCASCAGAEPDNEKQCLPVSHLPLDLLRCPPSVLAAVSSAKFPAVLDPHGDDTPVHLYLARDGVVCDKDSGFVVKVFLCVECSRYLARKQLPPLSWANGTYLGPLPPELKDLTFIEEAIIARARAKCWIVHLKEDKDNADTPVLAHHQRGFKGHIVVYPQRPEGLPKVLPLAVEDIMTPICVIFVGSTQPTKKWLEEKAKPLTVRRERIHRALLWLQKHNPLYRDVEISNEHLQELPVDGLLPYQIQRVDDSAAVDSLTARYDRSGPVQPSVDRTDSDESYATSLHDAFQRVVVTDVDARAPPNELRAAAVRHIKQKGGGFLQIPHGPNPVNEFSNPELFPSLYPTLFPYGLGGVEDRKRSTKLSLKRHVKHLLSLSDRRFQEHHSFLFTAFNILQRRAVLLHSSLKIKRARFRGFAQELANVSEDAVARVCARIAEKVPLSGLDAEERKVLKLMDEVQLVSRNVPGTSAARLAMRNELRALMVTHGTPHFYITINPADLYNPIVKLLSGAAIDVDRLLPEQVPDPWQQSILVARNPVAAAKFFHTYIRSFIKTLLRHSPGDPEPSEGVLGVTKAYYGCVEAQGRGTLHCHMVVWVEGGLNPSQLQERLQSDDPEFGQRLISFLDDSLSNFIPPLPADDPPSTAGCASARVRTPHPCATRGLDPDLPPESESTRRAAQEDLRNLVLKCQVHTHSPTCYKYCKDGDEKVCRFDLDPTNVVPTTTVDPTTGSLRLRHLDGLVNNYNSTILRAMRCNMDIKAIGSGEDAKSIVYYITDYITKTQLKTHIAYAALQLAVKKVKCDPRFAPANAELSVRAKRMLQRCAFSLTANQELSAPQVVSYLLEHGDQYSSHRFRNLYWPAFERFILRDIPDSDSEVPVTPGELEFEPEEPEGDEGPDAGDDDAALSQDGDEDEDSEDNDAYLETVQPDEVTIGRTADGELVELSSQVADYLMRGEGLEHLSLWDFVSRVDKVSAGTQTARPEDNIGLQGSDGHDDGQPPVNVGEPEPSAHRRTFVPFLADHPEYGRRRSKVLTLSEQFVPVPIGPALPRADRPDQRQRYCRLMLLLFTPWRTSADLKQEDETWEIAYNRAKDDFLSHHLAVIDNITELNMCRDSRDDLLSRGIVGRRHQRLSAVGEGFGSAFETDDGLLELQDEEAVLQCLESISATHSNRRSQCDARVKECLNIAAKYNLYRFPGQLVESGDGTCSASNKVYDLEATADVDPNMEARWASEYEKRRAEWKKTLTRRGNGGTSHDPDVVTYEPSVVAVEQNSLHDRMQVDGPRLGDPIFAPVETAADIEAHADKWTLNAEQRRAFRIVAEHSLKTNADPVRMFLGGFGGTGKSRVIQALTSYFQARNQSRRLRLASFTGIAARNISGSTLHAALSLSQQKKSRPMGPKTHSDLMAMWEGVDYLLIDEISMVGCKLLARVSEALIIAKGIAAAFGGMSIIVAGDFAQLPPVSEQRLYAWVNTHSRSAAANPPAQQIVIGKLLWLSFNTVVILTEVMRQSGSTNTGFVDLLSRLREGRCTKEDFDLLNTRLLERQHSVLDNAEWAAAPTIVYDNASKDALNVLAAKEFARRAGRSVQWYYSRDRYLGKALTDQDLLSHLDGLHSGQTRHRLGKIPLVIGMPVMISQNFDVNGGVVNGTIGTLKQIRYRTDRQSGRRYLTSCIVHVPGLESDALTGLDRGDYPVMEDTVSMTFRHPYKKKEKCTIRRTQVPIEPAFAITAHKSQGQTFSQVIVDLESCMGTEAPYVMLSRAKSLDGVIILRPFKFSKITCHQSGDIRKEVERLNTLALRTTIEYGSPAESRAARETLLGLDEAVDFDAEGQPARMREALTDRDEACIDTLNRVQKQLDMEYARRKRKCAAAHGLQIQGKRRRVS